MNRKHFLQAVDEETEINLIPIMNLFVALIPFLLLSAAFFSISVINASVPTSSEEFDLDPQLSRKITMSVQMDGRGFTLAAMSDDGSVTAAELAALSTTIPTVGKEHDYAKLTQILDGIKQNFRKSDTMILIPDRDIPYELVIKAMDASRQKGDRLKPEYLFPNVVVSSTVE